MTIKMNLKSPFYFLILLIFSSCSFIANDATARTEAMVNYPIPLGQDLCDCIKDISVFGNSVLQITKIGTQEMEVKLYNDFSYENVAEEVKITLENTPDTFYSFYRECSSDNAKRYFNITGNHKLFALQDYQTTWKNNECIYIKCNYGHEVLKIKPEFVTKDSLNEKWKNEETSINDDENYLDNVIFKYVAIQGVQKSDKTYYIFPLDNPDLKYVKPEFYFLGKLNKEDSLNLNINKPEGSEILFDVSAITVILPTATVKEWEKTIYGIDLVVYFRYKTDALPLPTTIRKYSNYDHHDHIRQYPLYYRED